MLEGDSAALQLDDRWWLWCFISWAGVELEREFTDSELWIRLIVGGMAGYLQDMYSSLWSLLYDGLQICCCVSRTE